MKFTIMTSLRDSALTHLEKSLLSHGGSRHVPVCLIVGAFVGLFGWQSFFVSFRAVAVKTTHEIYHYDVTA